MTPSPQSPSGRAHPARTEEEVWYDETPSELVSRAKLYDFRVIDGQSVSAVTDE